MSILVAKLFEVNMTEYKFVFSKAACIKTCIYFAIMYILVLIFNTMTISRYKLINLLNANKKNEKIRIRKPIIAILIFILGVGILSYAYYIVTKKANTLRTSGDMLKPILMGIIGTIAIFWSLSGFIITTSQKIKNTYLKGTNMFVLRQINNKINTTVASMSIICIMLFMTITILSSSLSLRESMQKDLIEMTPVDINLEKVITTSETYTDSHGNIHQNKNNQTSNTTLTETLINNGLDIKVLKDIIEIPIYSTNNLTLETFLGDKFTEIDTKYPFLMYKNQEKIIKISDYNKIADLYKTKKYDLNENEYIILCDFDNMENIRNEVLKKGYKLQIAGKEYISKYDKCQTGFIEMSTSHTNTGIIIVPDNCNLTEEMKNKQFLAANYNAKTEEEKEQIEKIFTESDSNLIQNINEKEIVIDGMSKTTLIESSLGITTIIIFIAIYLGIIFLIASSAILALKQLTESSDNKQRYTILRKIGCDEKMINKALYQQIGIFFLMPLLLAIIHSIFGIQFALEILSGITKPQELIPSIIGTTIIIGIIYGAYFLTTYIGSKNIIKEE